MIRILLIINIFLFINGSIFSQFLEGHEIDFDGFLCNEKNAFNIRLDTFKVDYDDYIGKRTHPFLIENTDIIIDVNCKLKTDSAFINYNLFRVKNKTYINGPLSIVSIENKSNYFIKVLYEIDSIIGISILNKEYAEVYSVSKMKLTGEYEEWSGGFTKKGHFIDGIRTGEWVEYHEYPIIKVKGTYLNKTITLNYNPTNNEIIEIYNFKDTLSTIPLNNYKAIFEKYNIIPNEFGTERFPKKIYFKDDEWNYYDEKGKLIKKEMYRDEELISVEEFP